MRVTAALLSALCLLALAACSVPGLPRVHKVTVQQGNVITQEMIDRLKPGMTRSQVAYLMGEPVYRNPFDDDRWDYIYTLEIPGYFETQQQVSLYFEDGVLAYFTGDYAPTSAKEDDAPADGDATAASDLPDGDETEG